MSAQAVALLDVAGLGAASVLFDVAAVATSNTRHANGLRKSYRCRQTEGNRTSACVLVEVHAEALEEYHEKLASAVACGNSSAVTAALSEIVADKALPDSRTALLLIESLALSGQGSRAWDGAVTTAAMVFAAGGSAAQARDVAFNARVVTACMLSLALEGRPDAVSALWSAYCDSVRDLGSRASRALSLGMEGEGAGGLNALPPGVTDFSGKGAAPPSPLTIPSDTPVPLLDDDGGLCAGPWDAAWGTHCLAVGVGATRAAVPGATGKGALGTGAGASSAGALAPPLILSLLSSRLRAGHAVPMHAVVGLALAEAGCGGRQAARDALAAAAASPLDCDSFLTLLAGACYPSLTADVRSLVDAVVQGGGGGKGKGRGTGGTHSPYARLPSHAWLAAALARGDTGLAEAIMPALDGGTGGGVGEAAAWLVRGGTLVVSPSPSLASLTSTASARHLLLHAIPTHAAANLRACALAATGAVGQALTEILPPPTPAPYMARYRPLPETLTILLHAIVRTGGAGGGPAIAVPAHVLPDCTPSPSSPSTVELRDAATYIAAVQSLLAAARGWGVRPRLGDVAAIIELHGAMGNTRLGMADIRASAPCVSGTAHPCAPVLYAALLVGMARAPAGSVSRLDVEWVGQRAAEDGVTAGHAGMVGAVGQLSLSAPHPMTAADILALFKVTAPLLSAARAAVEGSAQYDALGHGEGLGEGEASLRLSAVQARGLPSNPPTSLSTALAAPLLRLAALRIPEAVGGGAGTGSLCTGLAPSGLALLSQLRSPHTRHTGIPLVFQSGPAVATRRRETEVGVGLDRSLAGQALLGFVGLPSPSPRTVEHPADVCDPPMSGFSTFGAPSPSSSLLTPGLWRTGNAHAPMLSPVLSVRGRSTSPRRGRAAPPPSQGVSMHDTVPLASLPQGIQEALVPGRSGKGEGDARSNAVAYGAARRPEVGSGQGWEQGFAALTVSALLALDPWALQPMPYDTDTAASLFSLPAKVQLDPATLSGPGLFLALATPPPTLECGPPPTSYSDPRERALARSALPRSTAILREGEEGGGGQPFVGGPLQSPETVVLEEAVRAVHADSARLEAALHSTAGRAQEAEAELRAALAVLAEVRVWVRLSGGGGEDAPVHMAAGPAASAYLTVHPSQQDGRGTSAPLPVLQARAAVLARESALRSALHRLQAEEDALLERVHASPLASDLHRGYTDALRSLVSAGLGLGERTGEDEAAVQGAEDVQLNSREGLRRWALGGRKEGEEELPHALADALAQLTSRPLSDAARQVRASRSRVRATVEAQLERGWAGVEAMQGMVGGLRTANAAWKAMCAENEREVMSVNRGLALCSSEEEYAGVALVTLSQRAAQAAAAHASDHERIEGALTRVRADLSQGLAARLADAAADVSGALESATRAGRAEAASEGAAALEAARASSEAAVTCAWDAVAAELGPEAHARAALEARSRLRLEPVLEHAVAGASRAAGLRREGVARAKAEESLLAAAQAQLAAARVANEAARAVLRAVGTECGFEPAGQPPLPWSSLSSLLLDPGAGGGTVSRQDGSCAAPLDLLDTVESAVDETLRAAVSSMHGAEGGGEGAGTGELAQATLALSAVTRVYAAAAEGAADCAGRTPALLLGPSRGGHASPSAVNSGLAGPGLIHPRLGRTEGDGELERMLLGALSSVRASASLHSPPQGRGAGGAVSPRTARSPDRLPLPSTGVAPPPSPVRGAFSTFSPARAAPPVPSGWGMEGEGGDMRPRGASSTSSSGTPRRQSSGPAPDRPPLALTAGLAALEALAAEPVGLA